MIIEVRISKPPCTYCGGDHPTLEVGVPQSSIVEEVFLCDPKLSINLLATLKGLYPRE